MSKRLVTGDNEDNSDEEFQPRPKKQRKVNKPGSTRASRWLVLADMPDDILFLVISEMNIWEQNQIRGTCHYFRAAHDIYLRHEIKRAICDFNKSEFEGDYLAAKLLIGIKRGTQVYVDAGYESLMYDCLMPLLCCSYRTPFNIRNQNIKGFLTNCYDTVVAHMENHHSNYALMLYIMTMIDILRSFYKCNLNARNLRRKLILNFHLQHIWISELPKGFLDNPEKSSAFLALLTWLLISNLSQRPVNYVNEFYCRRLNSETDLQIGIVGSERIRLFFEEWAIDRSDENFQLPDNLNAENFHLDINISSKTGVMEMFNFDWMHLSV